MSVIWQRTWRSFVAAGALACGIAGTVVMAQAPGGYYDSADDLAAFRARLDAQEAELRQLRQRLNADAPARFASMADEKPAQAAAADEVFKQVEVVDKPTIKVGGRIFADHLMIDQDDLSEAATIGQLSNRSRFDQARIQVSGLVNEIIDYKIQVDFQGDVTMKDVWITVMQLPVAGNIRVGHFKEPFSLEELTSAVYLTFMERAAAGIFSPARRYGIMAFNDINDNQDATWFLGGFREGSDENAPDHISDDGYAMTGRVAWLPYYDEPTKGRYLLHLGAAASYRMPDNDTTAFSRDPGINISNANRIFRTSTVLAPAGQLLGVDNVGLGGLEAAAVMGPLSIQSEVYTARIDSGAAGEANLQSAYIFVSYFLTGENRAYSKATKTFDRVTPYENFFRVRTGDGVCCGRGAWEIGARLSYVDLIDDQIDGSRGDDLTVGLNWYMNPYTRLMFNWVHSDLDNRAGPLVDGGNADLYGVRFQIDF